jgi:hypothetical protein
MKWKTTNLQTRLYLIAAIVLLVGLGSAIFTYFTAENDPDSVMGYEDSKIFMHDLELYGGKANVLAHEFNRWFVGLWHGKSLAFTIACITIFISLVFFFVARHLPSDLKYDARGENNRTGTC